ncbi:MAG: NADH-quinone oxidoreductase subunit K [Candidatus Riesia sp.]|nr:NADH-quinone oxidoreductase subunit K [Candidatus Riesia sp.]
MLSLEIIFISSSIGFILSSIMIDDIFGFLFSLFLLTLAGAEVSFGLALTILSYRKFDNIFLNNLTRLKS